MLNQPVDKTTEIHLAVLQYAFLVLFCLLQASGLHQLYHFVIIKQKKERRSNQFIFIFSQSVTLDCSMLIAKPRKILGDGGQRTERDLMINKSTLGRTQHIQLNQCEKPEKLQPVHCHRKVYYSPDHN